MTSSLAEGSRTGQGGADLGLVAADEDALSGSETVVLHDARSPGLVEPACGRHAGTPA